MPQSFFATADIRPSRFVKRATTAGYVTECDAGDPCHGISQPATRNVPFSSLDDGDAAHADETLLVYTFPDKGVLLELGSGGATVGARLKADADGKGVITTTNLDEYGAIAEGSGNEGDLIPVTVVPPTQVSA